MPIQRWLITAPLMGLLQAPFGNPGYTGFCQNPPQPPEMTIWQAANSTWELTKTVFLSGTLSDVKSSFAIDNFYTLEVNGETQPTVSGGCAAWSPLATLPNAQQGDKHNHSNN